jgi:hypothetical protein
MENETGARKRSPWILRGAAIAVAAAFGGWIAHQFWPLRESKPPVKQVQALPAATKGITSPDEPVNATPPQPVGNDSSIRTTPQRLILVATEVGRTPAEGTARLGVDQSSPQTYVAGALLANGAQLAEVYADYVVLKAHGRTERLYLNETKKKPATSLAMVGGDMPRAPPPTPASDDLSKYLRLSVVYDSSGMVGYEALPGQEAGVFSQLGLRAGDVITAVDGMPLVEPASAWATLSRLAQGESLMATIRRDRSSQDILLDGASIVKRREPSAALPPG